MSSALRSVSEALSQAGGFADDNKNTLAVIGGVTAAVGLGWYLARPKTEFNRKTSTFGITSGAVDNFVYEEANETFINDPEMRKRLMELNPHSFRRIVGTLLEVNGRGYWETSDENITQLQEIYQEIEDRIEGVTN